MLQPARYTEILVNLITNPDTKAKIDQAMASYPLYRSRSTDNTYGTAYVIPTREQLNNKILNYYRWREIGFETVGRFLFELETALNEIMPYYNQLFYSADQDFNPIYNVDYKRTIDRNKDNQTTGEQSSETSASDSNQTTASTDGHAKNVHSATPQGVLNISTNNIDQVNYADDATWNHDNSTQTGSSSGTANTSGSNTSNVTGNESETTLETTKGNFGVVSAQDLILKYRDTILNIEQQIINDPRITELFMLVY